MAGGTTVFTQGTLQSLGTRLKGLVARFLLCFCSLDHFGPGNPCLEALPTLAASTELHMFGYTPTVGRNLLLLAGSYLSERFPTDSTLQQHFVVVTDDVCSFMRAFGASATPFDPCMVVCVTLM